MQRLQVLPAPDWENLMAELSAAKGKHYLKTTSRARRYQMASSFIREPLASRCKFCLSTDSIAIWQPESATWPLSHHLSETWPSQMLRLLRDFSVSSDI